MARRKSECRPTFMDDRRVECACGMSVQLTTRELTEYRREEKRQDMLLDRFNEHRRKEEGSEEGS